MRIKIELDLYGDYHRATTWLAGRCYAGLGESHAQAKEALVTKLKRAFAQAQTVGWKTFEEVEL
jgi:hypothetical protein